MVMMILIWTVPNGASMRPNTTVQQRIVRAARGVRFLYSCVHCVDAGAYTFTVFVGKRGCLLIKKRNRTLILAHEFRDHYSLQAWREMSVHSK